MSAARRRVEVNRLFSVVVCIGLAAVAGAVDPVHIDQFGYAPLEPKWVAVAAPADSFEVRDAVTGGVTLSGPLVVRRLADPASGDDVYEGEFTGLTAPGRYFVRVTGVGDSPDFVIDDAVYDDLFRKFMRGLYLQRCGTAITEEYGGAWTHESCHDHGGSAASYDWSTTGGAPGGYLDTIGGWHDAGDYGKYCTNNAYTVGLILQAYELYPSRFAHDDCGIPESRNGVPDLLDETRWSLEWMLKMQDGAGAVRHREAAPNYVGMYIPEGDPSTRYYTDVSSDATAVHAAAMALAARVYGSVDAAFAVSCSTSAAAAWDWLQSHPDRVPTGGFVNLYGHVSATYIAGNELEEPGRRLWAAAEIFRLTGATAARDYVDAHWGDGQDFNGIWYPDSWGAVENVGAFSYRDAPGATPGVVSGNWWSIENSVLSSSSGWQARIYGDGYACAASSDGTGDYYWGFTGVLLRYAWTMLEAYRYGGDSSYEQSAREQLHYILGRNPMGKVYVTGVGDRPVLHAHAAWNTAGGYTDVADSLCNPVPFQLIGGPNAADNPSISPYPAKCYEDIADPDYYDLGNYTLNETSVNIQASLIILAGYFSTGGVATGLADGETLAESGHGAVHVARLLPAHPCPFSQRTTIAYRMESPGRVLLEVFDVAGRRVATLEDGVRQAGRHDVAWDGRGADGSSAPDGVYFIRLAAPGAEEWRKLVRLN